jgi:hypothetical protein
MLEGGKKAVLALTATKRKDEMQGYAAFELVFRYFLLVRPAVWFVSFAFDRGWMESIGWRE